ncbi:MAG: hypothetical protein K0R03_1714 [Moraxellaceae bacterium]|jgi:3',5'-cyclic AMP phosphodiesterase CpdA|nr:hypothetical protein [Moraxellaceae bacterium]
MSVLLHISDTHFGTERPAVVEALLQLVHEEHLDAVLWSGDITQRARRAEFAAARRFAENLHVPAVLAIPGNHDIPLYNVLARAATPYAGYCRCFGPELEPVFRNDDVLVVALNTTRPWRHIDGEVSAAQVRRTADLLAAAPPEQLRVVVVHQPVGVMVAQDEKNLLHGHAAAVQAWQAAGADLVLGGHIHLPYVCELRAGSGHSRLWAVQAGTALSTRMRSGIPNSVNLIRYRPAAHGRHCTVERWDFDAVGAHFALVATSVLELGHR